MAFLLKEMLIIILLLSFVNGFKLPGSCDAGHYYEPSLLDCMPCRNNASLVTSEDGFGCVCEDHSIAVGIDQCKSCNITEVVSTDGTMCVSRRCQSSAGRIVCRKCPNDYISVTQNFDGSPMKEVQCIKCTRGYKALNNICVKCEACTCNKNEVIVKGKCIPKKFLLDRPKYAVNELHPDELLQIVKLEYLCTQHDIRACRALSSTCVRNFYTSDLAGPCRLWLQGNVSDVHGLPLLTIDESKISEYKIFLERGQDTLKIALGIHTKTGKFELIQDTSNNQDGCLPTLNFKIGDNTLRHCSRNISYYTSEYGDIFELFLNSPSNNLLPLPINLLKPNYHYVEKAAWSSNKFRKFFLITSSLSTTTNTTNTVYLQTLLFRARVERSTSLRLYLDIEAQYATKSHLTDVITTYVKVEYDMPSAGVLRSLEIWGGVLGSLLALYALIQWRGVVRRGGLYISLVPISLNCVADALYCATIISTLHALAAEAGTLELTLPLSQIEEHVIQSIIYTAVALKALKILWVSWNQCRCDIFFIDWSKYNPPTIVQQKSNNWQIGILVREWTSMQTRRRVSPGYTATSALLILHILNTWNSYIPKSYGYKWVIATVIWWSSYTILLCFLFLLDRLFGSSSKRLLKLCTDLELSLIVFQEEFYAHYVDGRNEDLMGFRSNSNPLQTCRIICSSQLRTVYRKLANTVNYGDYDRNQDLLSKFLGAFFERALDGLNWVASERTLFEKLLDVELITREGGNTSVLLYDTDITTPSCFAVTWLGEEWLLATFDAMLFGSVLILTGQHPVAALVTLIVWQIMKFLRVLFGSWNLRNKIAREN